MALLLLFRFYLGGPTSVRGFSMYSIGPQSEGKTYGFDAAKIGKVKQISG